MGPAGRRFVRGALIGPRLALVQMAVGNQILLMSPLARHCRRRCGCNDPTREGHAQRHGLRRPFRPRAGGCSTPLFDTQQAAALGGVGGGLGYQKLVEQLTGVALAKGETRSDWLRRPLSASQLEYAADDVRHLFAMHDTLDALLGQVGRRAWLAEDAARTVSNAEHEEGERWPHLSMRSAQFLEADAQLRLLRLLRWRDAQARSNDRPRRWILDNELATPCAYAAGRSAQRYRPSSIPSQGAAQARRRDLAGARRTPLADEAAGPDGRVTRARRQERLETPAGCRVGAQRGARPSRRHAGFAPLSGGIAGNRQLAFDALSGWRRDAFEPTLAPCSAHRAKPRGSFNRQGDVRLPPFLGR